MASAEKAAYLDRRVNSLETAGVVIAYDTPSNTTTWTLPYSVDPSGVDGTLAVVQESSGAILATSRPAANKISAVGNYSTTAVFIGVLYSSTYRLSTIFLRKTDGTVETRGRMQLRFLKFHYDNSTDFTVSVITSDGRTSSYIFNSAVAASGKFLVPIQAQNTTVVITLSCSTPGACNITGYEWEGLYYARGTLR